MPKNDYRIVVSLNAEIVRTLKYMQADKLIKSIADFARTAIVEKLERMYQKTEKGE
jgi:hypothetical protein